MKKSSIFILVLSILVVMFLSSFVGLSVGKNYAHEHYETKCSIEEQTIGGHKFYTIYYGCGEDNCHYCNGKRVSTSQAGYKSQFAEEFVYYRTINGFRITSLVCMIISAVGLTATFLIKYREPIKRVFKKEEI